jgi:hypothetical protein
MHDRMQSPRRPDLPQFGFESPESVDLFIDRAQRFLENNLLRGRGTDDLREVPAMGGVPVGPADVVQPEAEQEALQAQLGVLERQPRRIAGQTQVAEGFVLHGRDVDARQIARPEQPRELDRIAAVGLHFVAGLLRDQRGRDDVTVEPLAGQVAMQGVAAWSGLVGKHQLRRLRLQPPDQFVEVRLARADRAKIHRRIGALPQGMGDRDRILMDVETDEKRCRL